MTIHNNTDEQLKPLEYSINTDTNPMSSFHRALGVLALIIGAVVALIGLANGSEALSSWLLTALFFALASLPAFVVAEVIQILHDIRAKLYEEKKDGSKK